MPTWRREPAQDPPHLLGFPRAQKRKLSRLLADRGGLDVHGLVAGTGAQDRALHLAPVVLGHGQDVVVPDHGEIGKAESPSDRRATAASAAAFPGFVPARGRPRGAARKAGGWLYPAPCPGCRGIPRSRRQAPRIRRRLAARPPRRGKLVADPGEPLVEIADRSQRLDRLGKLFRLEHALLLGSTRQMANVVQPAEGGPQARCRVPRPSRWSAPAGHGFRRGRRSARSFAPRSCPASRLRGPRPERGPCRSREARACACPCPLTTAITRGDQPSGATVSLVIAP